MNRFVSIFLPHLQIERLQRERGANSTSPLADDKPFALVGNEERGLVLTAVNAAASREGLYPGLGLADARAICPALLTLPAAPKKDRDALIDLARWASCRYSPTLNEDGDDGLWLDVTGVPHLFGGERALLADMAGRLARAGFTARLALAETLGGAHALARYARNSRIIVPAGEIDTALASLPIEALRLAPEIVTLLKRLGLTRIGQLYELPRTSLERRFHAKETAEAVLLRLDQALGRRHEARVPLLPPPDFVARLPFPEPLITHDGVLAALDRLASALCAKLARAGRGCRRMAVWIARADGSSTVIEAGLSAPSRQPEHLLRLIEDKVEELDMGFGVDLMSLAALVTEELAPAQTSLTQAHGKAAAEPLIDRLINRLGARSVRRLFPKASHIPELAQGLKSALAGPSFWPEPTLPKPSRPPLLFSRPEPLTVLAEIPEGPPARFTWRHVTRRVTKAEGPERIAPEWWRGLGSRNGAANSIPPLDGEGGEAKGRAGWGEYPGVEARGRYGVSGKSRPRDYYRIEDEDGHRYWVFREGLYQESAGCAPGWYLHAVFG
ncbi:MAG TPA: DNA polymerase Y family protein [Methyloceanibacter sp.]|jgi:protein ImuB|nr:DNA polymerase Y family protein [Methyloceanibacter sp.]